VGGAALEVVLFLFLKKEKKPPYPAKIS